MFWMHLSGLFRSLPDRKDNLFNFLDRSSACWFAVVFTLDRIESPNRPWWCDGRTSEATRALCSQSSGQNAARSAAKEIHATLASLHAATTTGGRAYVVATRSHEPLMTDTAILQNFGATMAVHRAVLEHHGIDHLTRPSDVILQTRPDVIFPSAIDAAALHALFRTAPTPLLLVMRHQGGEKVGGLDPTEIAWFASRSALEQLCPDGTGCLGARRALELKWLGCGHPFVTLLIHHPKLDIQTFFVLPNWRLRLLRLGGDLSRGYNGPMMTNASTSLELLEPRRDLRDGLKCAVGVRDTGRGHNESACASSAAAVVRTRWGIADHRVTDHKGRFWVCRDTVSANAALLGGGALDTRAWEAHENISLAHSTLQRIRYCPSCAGPQRVAAIERMQTLSAAARWTKEQLATLRMLKQRLVGNASVSPVPFHGDNGAVCMWDCVRRATMMEPLAADVLQRGVPGDFLEAGVFRGGIAIHMAAMLAVSGKLGNGSPPLRRMWLADSFAGMPDRNYSHAWASRRRDAGHADEQAEMLIARDRDARGLSAGILQASLDEVSANVRRHLAPLVAPLVAQSLGASPCEPLEACGVHLLQGFFSASLPGPVRSLSLLRIDADLYTSIFEVLESLYPLLSVGGYVVFDDFKINQAKAAILDYRLEHGITSQVMAANRFDRDGTGYRAALETFYTLDRIAFWQKSAVTG